MSESEIQRRNQQKFSNFCSEIESLLEDGTSRLFFSFEIGYFYFYLIFILFHERNNFRYEEKNEKNENK